MSDIKKIKDEFLLKLKENLDLNQINEIKSDLSLFLRDTKSVSYTQQTLPTNR